jgi:glycosyltransferase involved in cell wall biosynthesis
MSLDISVIIPTVNRLNILKKTLDALLNQSYPKENYEIIVVDDGSTDGTEDMVTDFCKGERPFAPTITYLRQSPNKKGPAAANNLGIKNAKGEYVLFLNDDVIADHHLIEEHMKYHVRTGRDRSQPGIIVQGRVINTSSLDDLGKKHEGYGGGYSDLSFGYFTTWNCSIKKQILIDAGLFDEDFVNLCWEDVEFGYRLRKMHIKQKYNKMAFGYHYRSEFSLKDLNWVKTKSINMGINAMIYYRKHPILEVKISTQSFWLPFAFHSLLSLIINFFGREKIRNYLFYLENKKRKRFLGFFVGLAGYYWYLCGVKKAKIDK